MPTPISRWVYIREYDFIKMQKSALKLYDRVTFTPLTKSDIDHKSTIELLKNPDTFNKLNMPDWYDCQDPILRHRLPLLAQKIRKMYNVNYAKWTWEHDSETDLIYIQAKSSGPKSPLGIAWFEKDVQHTRNAFCSL